MFVGIILILIMKLLFLILLLFEIITTKANSAALSDVENPVLQLTLGAITIENYKSEELENIKDTFGEEMHTSAMALIKKIPEDQISVSVLHAVFEGLRRGYVSGEKSSPRKESPRSSNLKKFEEMFILNSKPRWGIREIREADPSFDAFIKLQDIDKINEDFWMQALEVVTKNITTLSNNFKKLSEAKSSIDMAVKIYRQQIGPY